MYRYLSGLFFVCSFIIPLTTSSGASQPSTLTSTPKPNVLLILMDDFGVGQFAPTAKGLTADQISENHKAFVESLGNNAYDVKQAIEFAQKAMPTLDRLASEGALFTNAFSSSNLCAPSRTGILTGRNHIRWGSYRNMDVNINGLPKGSVLVERFQEAGYHTGLIGKLHVDGKDTELKEKVFKQHGISDSEAKSDRAKEALTKAGYFGSITKRSHPLNNGFDYYFGYNRWECPFYDYELIWENFDYQGKLATYNTDLFTQKAIGFINDAIQKKSPFFLELALHTMHQPLHEDPPEEYQSQFQSGSEYLDKYYAHLRAVDVNIARILDMLQQHNVLENTIIVFTADNGATCTERSVLPGNAPHRGYKATYFRGGFQVPLVMWYPKQIDAGTRIQKPVSLMDIIPTALAFADLKIPDGIDGIDLSQSLENTANNKNDSSHPRTLIWAGIHSRAWGFDRHIKGGNWDKWRDHSPAAWVVLEEPFLLRYISPMQEDFQPDYPHGQPASLELFNIYEDPMERTDLSKNYPEVVEQLKSKYHRFAKELPEPKYQKWDRSSWENLLNVD